MTTHRPFVMAVSHATRACGSCPSIPSSTASETWSQILSGCPSVTDSDVRRNEGEELKLVVTTGHDKSPRNQRLRAVISRGPRSASRCLRPVVVPAVLWLLPEEVGLQGEDVVEHAVDAPALEAVIGDNAGLVEVTAQGGSKRAVDSRLAADLGLLQQLQAPVERQLSRFVGRDVHSVPSTSMRPAAVTRT